jgi:hypothetical protein
MRRHRSLMLLAAFSSLTLIIAVRDHSFGASKETAGFDTLNAALIRNAPDLQAWRRDSVRKFLDEGVLANYGPAYYLRGMYFSKGSQIASDALTALRLGVSSAATLQALEDASGLPLQDRRDLYALTRLHLEKLESKGVWLSSYFLADLQVSSAYANARLPEVYAEKLRSMAEHGSPMAIGIILGAGGLNPEARARFCNSLKIKYLREGSGFCSDVVSSSQARPTVESHGTAQYVRSVRSRLTADNLRHFSEQCKFNARIDAGFETELLCADLLSADEYLCVLHTDSNQTAAVNGLNICSASVEKQVRQLVSRIFQMSFGVEIF